MRIKLASFIEENKPDIIVTGGVSEEKIKELEEVLGFTFRGEYRDFLAQYGMLLGYGVEILGCGRDKAAPVVTQTERFRRFGLTDEYIVIRNADEWIYCLNNNNGRVSVWDRGLQTHMPRSDSFEGYVLDELSRAKVEGD